MPRPSGTSRPRPRTKSRTASRACTCRMKGPERRDGVERREAVNDQVSGIEVDADPALWQRRDQPRQILAALGAGLSGQQRARCAAHRRSNRPAFARAGSSCVLRICRALAPPGSRRPVHANRRPISWPLSWPPRGARFRRARHSRAACETPQPIRCRPLSSSNRRKSRSPVCVISCGRSSPRASISTPLAPIRAAATRPLRSGIRKLANWMAIFRAGTAAKLSAGDGASGLQVRQCLVIVPVADRRAHASGLI